MAIVTLIINNKHFQIACADGEEERLKSAAEVLNQRVEELRELSPKATTELLLIMCGLGMQDEISNLQNKLARMGDTGEDEKVSETLSTIAGYLESLAQKITR